MKRTRALRATRSSDVTRARVIGLAALGAALGAGGALAFGMTPASTSRPLDAAHVKAKIACASCHDAPPAADAKTFTTSGACKTCHAAAEHVSARAPHRALAQKGLLTCATCHPAHEGAQGVTFGEGGVFTRWGAGATAEPHVGSTSVSPGKSVPLVSVSACAKCHDPSSAKDPVSACVPSKARQAESFKGVPSLCFDEHKTTSNAEARLVAWDAAREVATTTRWVKSESPRTPFAPFAPLGGAFAGALVLGASAALLERKKRSAAQPAPSAPLRPAERKKLPVVNVSTCLGCYACVDACPFDVLTIEKYVAVVARPEECCGVVLCEQVCPNGSLTIDVGEKVADRPNVDEHLESADVPGLFLAGDLTGLPLIKNAISQGVRAIDRIAMGRPRSRPGTVDVLVIGAGPAGLSAALRAKEKGLSCVVLEQATVAASVKSFPRDKIVYDPPLDLPVEGELWLKEATKEELVAQWTRIVRSRALDIREHHRVTNIERDPESFVVTAGERYRASRVVIAIGRRGTPRLLELAITSGAESRVSYALADARSFAGKRIVIAGLGDTAMEAAIALARQPETAVTITYRGADFARGKARNIAEVKDLAAKGRLRILFETIPIAVANGTITVEGVQTKARRTLQADALLVLVGGVPSWDLLARAGITRP